MEENVKKQLDELVNIIDEKIEKSSNPVGQMTGIISKISAKHNIKKSELENFIDNEIIK